MMFIPYDHLSTDPLPIQFFGGNVQASIKLIKKFGDECDLIISSKHRFEDKKKTNTLSTGAVFELEYRGVICEFRIGRRIMDA